VKALWAYDAKTDQELSFQEDDLLVNVVTLDNKWLTGETEKDVAGSFPKSYPPITRHHC
jgi:hypothetical protein